MPPAAAETTKPQPAQRPTLTNPDHRGSYGSCRKAASWREDIPLLATHFLQRCARGIEATLRAYAEKALLAYDWPGNVRELRNVIERAAILAGRDERIRPEHFGPLLSRRENAVIYAFDHEPALAEVERECQCARA